MNIYVTGIVLQLWHAIRQSGKNIVCLHAVILYFETSNEVNFMFLWHCVKANSIVSWQADFCKWGLTSVTLQHAIVVMSCHELLLLAGYWKFIYVYWSLSTLDKMHLFGLKHMASVNELSALLSNVHDYLIKMSLFIV